MALVKVKPTSPGRRAVVKVVNPNLHKGARSPALLEPQSKHAGRNNNGHITTRHQGGGHKQHYRLVDFKRNKDGIPAKVERLEYDPNRTANIALLCYADGERRYVIAPKGHGGWAAGTQRFEAPIKSGNALPIRNIPVGTTIHCIEMIPGKGANLPVLPELRRSCWLVKGFTLSCACVPAKFAGFTSNAERPSVKWVTKSIVLRSIGKAGQIAGAAFGRPFAVWSMNPVDHPHGGGEGRTAAGMHPVSPWGTSRPRVIALAATSARLR
jgi:large subunit ribosomal protein L2